MGDPAGTDASSSREGVAGEQRCDSPAVEPAPPDESPVTQGEGRGGGVRSVRQQTQNEDGCEAVLVDFGRFGYAIDLAGPIGRLFVARPWRADGLAASALGGRTAGATRS